MDKIKYVIAVLLLAGCVHILVKSMLISQKSQTLKYELASLNDAKYGIFNVDNWKHQINIILTQEIAEFQLEGDNKKIVKVQLEKLLETLLDQVKENVLSQNNSGIWGKLKGMLVDVVIDFDKIKKEIPAYADDILAELEKEENIEAIKAGVLSKMDGWMQSVGEGTNTNIQSSILEKHEQTSIKDCSSFLQSNIGTLQKSIWMYTLIGILFSILLWIVMLAGEANKLDNYILGLSCLLLLVGGLFIPMLDLKAGLETIRFTILDNEIKFDDQVLFFQSKSIVQVVKTLLSVKSFNGILVGILILLFSVIFPLAKLLSSIAFINNHRIAKNRVLNFLIFHSGKWSMADVFVVALLMTYLGFSGIVQSQLGAIPNTDNIQTISFNATSFQPGCTWFIGFCISGLFFSTVLKKLALSGRTLK